MILYTNSEKSLNKEPWKLHIVDEEQKSLEKEVQNFNIHHIKVFSVESQYCILTSTSREILINNDTFEHQLKFNIDSKEYGDISAV